MICPRCRHTCSVRTTLAKHYFINYPPAATVGRWWCWWGRWWWWWILLLMMLRTRTSMMIKILRLRRRWRRRFWCRSRSGWQVNPKGWIKRAPKLCLGGPDYGFGLRKNHSPTRGKFREANPRGQNPGGKIRTTDFDIGKSLNHDGQNPGIKIRTTIWNSEIQTSTGDKIREDKFRATDLELGNPNTLINNFEIPET